MSEEAATRWVPSSIPDREVWLPRPGMVVAARYVVERILGGGGMGAVVAARHLQLGEPVAIKFLHPRLATDVASVERFVREARAASRIKSEHVIRIYDVGATDDGLPYIAMELLEGMDLAHFVARGPLPTALAADCVLQASEALASAHAAGIVHRDIKPSNLWLSQRIDGTPLVKVLDFGISKLASIDGDAKLTETQAVFGSPMYMSPEQIRSAKRVDHRTDVWALGVVLYELLSGRVPFDADNVAGVLAAVTADPPAPLACAGIPPELEALIHSCLIKDPTRRATLSDLAAGLRAFASPAGVVSADRIDGIGKPSVSLMPTGPISSIPVPSYAVTETVAAADLTHTRRRTRAWWASAGIVAGVLLGAISVRYWLWDGPTATALAKPPDPVIEPPIATSAPAHVESPAVRKASPEQDERAEATNSTADAAPEGALAIASSARTTPPARPNAKPRSTRVRPSPSATPPTTSATAGQLSSTSSSSSGSLFSEDRR